MTETTPTNTLSSFFAKAFAATKAEPLLVTPYLLFFLGINSLKHVFPLTQASGNSAEMLPNWQSFAVFMVANCITWAWASQLNYAWLKEAYIDIRETLTKTATYLPKLVIGTLLISLPTALLLGLSWLINAIGITWLLTLITVIIFPLTNLFTFGIFQFLPYFLIRTDGHLINALSLCLSFFLSMPRRILNLTMALFLFKLLALLPVMMTLAIPVLGEGLLSGVIQGAVHTVSVFVVGAFFYAEINPEKETPNSNNL